MKGAIPSPNIWNTPHIYELENRAVDPEGRIEAAIAAIRPWTGSTVLDIGCGTGYHLPATSATAARVIGVEPHGDLVELARRRCRALPNVEIHAATAQALPLPDASVDVAVARWAYFFGPGCEPGLAELSRVVRHGGAAFVIDIDATRGAFGRWFSQSIPAYSTRSVENFWAAQGWTTQRLDLRMSFERRADLEAVLRIEFTPAIAERAIAETPGLEIAYPNLLRWRLY
ncbi:methyltransferase type 11 [Planobispora rosea]|uniref:Methyltransferase type 11 n=1 Tax=Planobispora rosea TaxID=35762 RepID=A0A8J3WAK0_PLARO|nr:methyltransferase type 11 [Planobispora rosea]GIH81887.1 methyltransferase type 11 [Planobispora rosea]